MQRLRPWLPLSLIVAGLLVYANSLRGPFIFDDAHGIQDNPSIQRLWPVWDALVAPPGSGMAGRPIVNFSFAINYAIGGVNVEGYHVVNLVIHLLAGLTLLGVLRRTMKHDLGAWCGALIWLVHPVLTESVDYISQRTEMLMGLFALLTLYCVIRGWNVRAVVACGVGMGCKEVMAVMPVLVLAYDYVFLTGSWKESWRQRRPLYLGLAATWLMVPLLIGGVSVRSKMGNTGEFTPWSYAKIECTILVRYLRLCVWPTGLLLDYEAWPRVESIRQIIPHGLLIVGLVAASIWGTLKRRWWGFLGLWFFVILAPTSSFLPIGTEVGAERRLYLPVIAVVVAFVVCVRYQLIPALVVAAVLGVMTWQRNEVYSDAVELWADTAAKAPLSFRARNNYGNALAEVGRDEEAMVEYRQAAAIRPDNWKVWNNLAILLAKYDKLAEALECFERAVALNGGNAPMWVDYGVALARSDRLEEAVRCFEAALTVDPTQVTALYNLGRAYAKLGRYPVAVAKYRAALELQPTSAAVLHGLGTTLAKAGQTNEARVYLQRAAEKDPAARQALDALR